MGDGLYNRHCSLSHSLTNVSTSKLNGTTSSDVVSAAGLSVPDQAIGSVKTHKFIDVKPGFHPWTRTGVIGFSEPYRSTFTPQSGSWFWNLCHNKAISECRFGLLFDEYLPEVKT
jgi:hypothetical protein